VGAATLPEGFAHSQRFHNCCTPEGADSKRLFFSKSSHIPQYHSGHLILEPIESQASLAAKVPEIPKSDYNNPIKQLDALQLHPSNNVRVWRCG
jgi:hypothetical protein